MWIRQLQIHGWPQKQLPQTNHFMGMQLMFMDLVWLPFIWGPFISLPNNFKHQIYPSVLFMVRNFYQLYLPVLFMAENFHHSFLVVEFFLIIKITSKFDHSISNHKSRLPKITSKSDWLIWWLKLFGGHWRKFHK